MTSSSYQLRRLSDPGFEPISLADARKECKVDPDITDEDDLIASWISAARELAENFTGRVFIDSHWELTLDGFPCNGQIRLPRAPLIAVVSVQYQDAAGDYQLLDPSSYVEIPFDEPPRVVWNSRAATWPYLYYGHAAVKMELRMGYASNASPDDASRVPALAKQAIRMMVAHWYENREAVATETRNTPTVMPYGFEELLQPLRIIY